MDPFDASFKQVGIPPSDYHGAAVFFGDVLGNGGKTVQRPDSFRDGSIDKKDSEGRKREVFPGPPKGRRGNDEWRLLRDAGSCRSKAYDQP